MGGKQTLLVVVLLLIFGMFQSLSHTVGQQKNQTQPKTLPRAKTQVQPKALPGTKTPVQPKAQTQPQAQQPVTPPVDIQFTNQMSRARKDMQWSMTYHASYKRTKEIPYLQLAAKFCLKAINRLADIQKTISRTTKFYNMADEKRLQACRFYTKLQRMSFLLKPKYHFRGSGNACK